jgi:hypothetical protein
MLEWVGGPFDPEAFDPQKVSRSPPRQIGSFFGAGTCASRTTSTEPGVPEVVLVETQGVVVAKVPLDRNLPTGKGLRVVESFVIRNTVNDGLGCPQNDGLRSPLFVVQDVLFRTWSLPLGSPGKA